MQGTSLEGAGQECLGLVLNKSIKYGLINLIQWILVFLMNGSPAIKSVGRNRIHHLQWAPTTYQWIINTYKINHLAQL
jgi:hypothetical protein